MFTMLAASCCYDSLVSEPLSLSYTHPEQPNAVLHPVRVNVGYGINVIAAVATAAVLVSGCTVYTDHKVRV